jgi:F0F1-type ATP synthase assembly protein I
LAYAAGLVLFTSVVTLMGAGYLFDLWLMSSPWGIVGGIVLGTVVGFYQFIKITNQID